MSPLIIEEVLTRPQAVSWLPLGSTVFLFHRYCRLRGAVWCRPALAEKG